jgi:predicted permease
MNLDTFLTEARRAARRLAANRAFTLFSVATLAIGLGATAALHAVIYAILLRPLDVPNIDRLANIYHSDPQDSAITAYLPLSWPDYQDLQAQQSGFSELFGWAQFRQSVVAGGSVSVTMGEVVSGGYFRALGLRPAVGRLIESADDESGRAPVVVLGDGFARAHFVSGAAAVGQSVLINRQPFRVIGVVEASFRGVAAPNVVPTALWVPLHSLPSLGPAALRATLDVHDRERRWIWVKGLLGPGASALSMGDQVHTIGQRLDLAFPIGRGLAERFAMPQLTSRNWTVVPTTSVHSHESVSGVAVQTAWLLFSAVTAVLLIGCSNLANLATARGMRRRHELAVRMALGASKSRIAAELLIEGGLLVAAGCVVAPLVFVGLVRYVLSAALRFGAGFTIQVDPTMTQATYVIVLGALALATVVAAVLPALSLTRAAIARGLSSESAQGTIGRWASRRNLISVQVAISTVLVCLASMCVLQASANAARSGGGWMDDLALVQLDMDLSGHDETRARLVLDAIVASFPRGPASTGVIVSSGLPAGPSAWRAEVVRDDLNRSIVGARRWFALVACTSSLLSILPTRIVAGRGLDDRDDMTFGPPIAVISESAAVALFGTAPAVGRRVSIRPPPTIAVPEQKSTLTEIVGVMSDIGSTDAPASDARVIYVPFSRQFTSSVTLVVRGSDDAEATAGILRKAVLSVAPDAAIVKSGSGRALGDAASVPLRASAGIASVLGAVCVILSMTGLYGILSYLVSGRAREIGVRLTLGQTPLGVMKWILLQGLRPIGEGLAIGLAVTVAMVVALRPWMSAVLPAAGLSAIAVGPIVLVLAGLIACYLPALRASRIDPAISLRDI